MSYIRKLPNGKYRAEISKNYTSIQSKTFPTEKKAVEWAESIEQNITHILSIKPKKLRKLSPEEVKQLGGVILFQKLGVDIEFITYRTLVNEYLSLWAGKDDSYYLRSAFWLSAFSDTPIKSIKPSHIDKILAKYAAGQIVGYGSSKPKSNNTVLRMKSVLSSIFQFAMDKNYLDKNPATKVRIKAVPNQIERFLSEDERERLLNACKEASWDRMYLLVLLAITTGMRKSELLNLRWSDINFEDGLATLNTTKNGEKRINPIPTVALDELKQHREVGSGLIFFSRYNLDKPIDFRKPWFIALEKAQITDFRFHDLRHTAASYLVMGGATLHETGEILGHKSEQTTKRYAHLSTGHKSALSERVMNKVFNNK